jgi:hypothetical protein
VVTVFVPEMRTLLAKSFIIVNCNFNTLPPHMMFGERLGYLPAATITSKIVSSKRFKVSGLISLMISIESPERPRP